jgi:hypothetical protein
MLKQILKQEGVYSLSKEQQKGITGGKKYCGEGAPCPASQCCVLYNALSGYCGFCI